MQEAFERYVVSGDLAKKGAADNGHTATLSSIFLTREGDAKRFTLLSPTLSYLEPGQSLHRVWGCKKKGFQTMFGLDTWKHTENISKKKNSLRIKDEIAWHHGKSTASLEYAAFTVDDKLKFSKDKWRVDLAGLRWPVKQYVEKVLSAVLPRTTDKSIDDFLLLSVKV